MIEMTEIRTPVKGFTGQVVGVNFVDGVGETDDPIRLAYFQRRGYGIGAAEVEPKPVGKTTKSADKTTN